MKEFVYGTDYQYNCLKEQLDDCMCHVYHCSLPKECNPNQARIGFEKEGDNYAIFIDKGICYAGEIEQFQEWLSQGCLRFLEYSNMKTYLKSLSVLY